jgi:hypothetical protein
MKKTPWLAPEVSFRAQLPFTLHGKDWLSVFIDEVHVIRRQVPQYQQLIHKSHAIICATATPLHTGLMDLVNLSHLLHLPDLCCEDKYGMALTHERKISRMRSQIPKDEFKKVAEATMSGSMIVESPGMKQWKNETKIFVQNISNTFEGQIIRRLTTSKDWKGGPISDLVPYEEAAVFLNLKQSEYKQLDTARENEHKE